MIIEGAWVLFRYGHQHDLFYVAGTFGDKAVLGKRNWLVGDTIVVPLEHVEQSIVVGYSKPRWWRRFVPPPFRALICPYQMPPRALAQGLAP